MANNFDGSSYETTSKILKWNDGAFSVIQSLPTLGAYAFESFVINGETYLAVANYRNNSSYNVQSAIYKWNTSSFSFDFFQAISTYGASSWKSFVINGDTYLAVANAASGASSQPQHNINSVIYKWNGSSFVEFQSIPTNSAFDWESFVINGETYLAVANYFNNSTRLLNQKYINGVGHNSLKRNRFQQLELSILKHSKLVGRHIWP